MPPAKISETTKALSIRIAERCNNLELTRTKSTEVARNMMLGAREMATLTGNHDLAKELQDAYAIFVELGYSRILKWAGVHDQIEEPEQKAAA